MNEGFDVYRGLDVGKAEHQPRRRTGFDEPLPQDDARPRELFTTSSSKGTC